MDLPLTTDGTPRGDRSLDVLSRLLRDRVVFLWEEISQDTAVSVVSQLLLLSSEDDSKPISLYILSPGGEITAAMAIYDTMQIVRCPVATYCLGEACSAAAFLLASGHPGKRFALPSSRIMIHQPQGGAEGDHTDIQIQAQEMSRLRQMMFERMAVHTGRTVDEISRDCERDRYMGVEEALKYGVIDKVVSYKKATPRNKKKNKSRKRKA